MNSYPDLGSASGWLKHIPHVAQPIRNTTQIWVVMQHHYGISSLLRSHYAGGPRVASRNVGCFRNQHRMSYHLQMHLCVEDQQVYPVVLYPSLFVKANFSEFLGFIRELLQGRLASSFPVQICHELFLSTLLIQVDLNQFIYLIHTIIPIKYLLKCTQKKGTRI